MSTSRVLVTSAVVLGLIGTVVAPASAQVELEAELAMERPIPALNTIWIEEMPWIEIRDALGEGKRTKGHGSIVFIKRFLITIGTDKDELELVGVGSGLHGLVGFAKNRRKHLARWTPVR